MEHLINPDELPEPKVRMKDTGKIYKVSEINWRGRYVVFFPTEKISWEFKDERGELRVATRDVGQPCLRKFDDLEFVMEEV